VTDYFYDMDLVVDPLNPANVVANGQVSIYDPADTTGATLLALKDPSGLPLPNPLTSNANGFLPPRIATVPQTMWKSGGFTGYFNSYKGLRDESVAAVTAAQSAANDASTAAAQVVTTATVDGSGALVLTKASGATVNAGNVKGQKGDKGDKGDKGLDGSNVLPTDDAIKQAINDTASATRGALNATYEPKGAAATAAANKRDKVDFRSRFTTAPVLIGHRSGPLIFPEESMEGARATAAAGFVVDVDLGPLSDGTLVCIHDNTVERTMTGIAGNTWDNTKAQWLNGRIKPVIPGGQEAMPYFWDDMLDEMGGRFPIHAELKIGGVHATTLINSIKSRGLEKAVLVSSFQYADCQTLAAAGLMTLYAIGVSAPPQTPAQIKADGIDFVCAGDAAPAQLVTDLKAAGITVLAYTVNTPSAYTAAIGKGFAGVWSDDPWGVTGRYAKTAIQDFRSGYLWPLATRYTGGPATLALDPATPGVKMGYTGTTETSQSAIRMGCFGFGPAVSRVRFKLQFLPGASQTDRWIALWIGQAANSDPFLDSSTPGTVDGYNFLIRRNGNKHIYKRSNGSTAATQLVLHTSTAFVATTTGTSATLDFEVVVDATNVTLRCLTDGTEATVADATYRGTDAMLSFLANSTAVTVSDVRITR